MHQLSFFVPIPIHETWCIHMKVKVSWLMLRIHIWCIHVTLFCLVIQCWDIYPESLSGSQVASFSVSVGVALALLPWTSENAWAVDWDCHPRTLQIFGNSKEQAMFKGKPWNTWNCCFDLFCRGGYRRIKHDLRWYSVSSWWTQGPTDMCDSTWRSSKDSRRVTWGIY